jgi:RND family efflux transporter MFP subunit
MKILLHGERGSDVLVARSRYSLLWRTGGLVALTSLLLGCSGQRPPAQPSLVVNVSQPLAREIIDYDDYEGHIEAVKTIEVRAPVSGDLLKVNFQDGQIVKPGDLLYEIDPRPYKVALDAAEAQLAVVRSGQASGTLTLFDAQAAVDQAKLDLDSTRIVSSIHGMADPSKVSAGNVVKGGRSGTLLTTIGSVDPIYVYLDVPERSLLLYRRHFGKNADEGGTPASIKELKITIDVALEGESAYSSHQVIDFAHNRVDPSTGMIRVRGLLPNPDRLLEDGTRVRVRVPISHSHSVLMVTEQAIRSDQTRQFVYVVNNRNVVERHNVEVGRSVDGMRPIEPLSPTDWVIVKTNGHVEDGMRVQPQQVPMPGAGEPANAEAKPSNK